MDNREESILHALENPKYTWRTIKGVARDANTSEYEAYRTLSSLKSKGVVVTVVDREHPDKELYTTRDHLKKKSSLADRVIAILQNRGA